LDEYELQEEKTMAGRPIDLAKVHAALQGLSDRQVRHMLEEAIDMLPPAKLIQLVKSSLNPAKLRPDRKTKGRLLAAVKAFEKASRADEYYETFNVNSKNWQEKSRGTRLWIAECDRLFARCTAEAGPSDPAELCQAFDILFALLDRIDEDPDHIVFFADEGGSWQVGVDWEEVLPAWFACLAATTEPQEYARRVREAIEEHGSYRRKKHLSQARKVATPAQRQALRGAE
jgi:hypothetical protein